MNPIVYKLLLAGGKFIPEIHLRKLRFTYSTCGPFTKNKKRIKNVKNWRFKIYLPKRTRYSLFST